MDEKVRELLLAERDGCHGESERRAVAEFVLDALGDDGGEHPELPERLAYGLADTAADLAFRLKNIRRGKSWAGRRHGG